ncbi:MAG TPA: hypothetical protein VM734_24540 [Kofleriaceae bacterium]|jgi:hypothetical protein|nr:hypothetical protein [Kofleriaceae bacterium]
MRELRFTVFGTIGQSVGVWAKNIVPITVLGLLFFSPLIIWTGTLVADLSSDGYVEESSWTVWFIVTTMLAYAFDQLLAAPIVYGVVQELNGTRAGIGACIAQGLKRFFPVFITVFLLYWCVVFGTYSFVIPGIVMACGLYVAVPAAVCERPGVMGTLTRSFHITEGNRMRIFGLLLLFWGARIGAKWALIAGIDPEGHAGKMQAVLLGSISIDFLFGCLGAIMQAVTYSRLRQLRDGVSTNDLARVFE